MPGICIKCMKYGEGYSDPPNDYCKCKKEEKMPKEKVKGVHFEGVDLPLNVWIKISKAEGGKFGFEYTKDSIEKHIKKLEIKEGDILVVHEDLKMALLTAKIDGVPDCKIIFTDDLDKIRKDSTD